MHLPWKYAMAVLECVLFSAYESYLYTAAIYWNIAYDLQVYYKATILYRFGCTRIVNLSTFVYIFEHERNLRINMVLLVFYRFCVHDVSHSYPSSLNKILGGNRDGDI